MFLVLLCSSIVAIELPFPTTIQELDAIVSLSASGTISEPGGTVTLKVLSFQETSEQKISSLRQVLTINGKEILGEIESDDYGNRYAVFEVNEAGSFVYVIEAEIIRTVKAKSMKDFDLTQKISEQEIYNKETKTIESDSATIRTLALNRFRSDSWLETLAEISHWTHNYVTYDTGFYPETYGAIATLESKRGTCDEFATLSAAILRAKGIPTRVVVGPVFSAEAWNFHGWLQVYNPNSGWIAMDSTYGEAGLVDATHIEMGHFPDFTNAADLIIAPTKVSVEISPKEVNVEARDVKQFSGLVALEIRDVEIKANRWNDLNIGVKNHVDSYLILPLEMVLPQGFATDERDKTILLKPLEDTVVFWKTRIDIELEKNQYLEGQYAVFSFHEPAEGKITVLPGEMVAEDKGIAILDLKATIDGSTLKIEFLLDNSGETEANIEIELSNEGRIIERTSETVEQRGRKIVTFAIAQYEKTPYLIKITGDAEYDFTIVPQGEIKSPLENLDEKSIEQTKKILYEVNEFLPEEFLTPGNVVFVIIAVSAIAVMFLLKDLVLK